MEPKTVTLSPEFWGRVDMALDIAKFRSMFLGSRKANQKYEEVQVEIQRQLGGDKDGNRSNRTTDS